jgi:hypothetical protein
MPIEKRTSYVKEIKRILHKEGILFLKCFSRNGLLNITKITTTGQIFRIDIAIIKVLIKTHIRKQIWVLVFRD